MDQYVEDEDMGVKSKMTISEFVKTNKMKLKKNTYQNLRMFGMTHTEFLNTLRPKSKRQDKEITNMPNDLSISIDEIATGV